MNDVMMDLLPDGRIALRAPAFDVEECKKIQGLWWDDRVHFNGGIGAWCGPFSWATCVIARGVFGQRLAVGVGLAERASRNRDNVRAANDVRESINPDLHQLNDRVDEARMIRSIDGKSLLPFQVCGAAWLTYGMELMLSGEFEGTALTDEMGLGKTVQVIAALRLINARRVLVICPKSMKKTWCREVERWWPGTSTHEVSGDANKRRKAIADGYSWPDVWDTPSVTVINWEAVRQHTRLAPYGSVNLKEGESTPKELNQPWDAVIVDEIHRVKDPTSKQARGAWSVAHAAKIKIGMTGTPVANHLGDMWSIMHTVAPREAPQKTKYIDRFALTTFGAYGGIEIAGIQPGREAEFRAVYDELMRRAPKAAVLPQLPPLVLERRPIEMEKKQLALYRKMEDDAFAIVETETGTSTIIATNPAVQATRLMQFASSYCTVTSDPNDGSSVVTPVEPSNKVDALLEFIDDELGDKSLVVFALHRKLIELVGEKLNHPGPKRKPIPHGYIVGGQTEGERQDAIDAFQAGHTKIVLCTIAAGGVGITLSAASVCVFLQRSFSLVDNLQAEGRVHRIGSEVHESVHVIDFFSPETADEIALAIRDGKIAILQEVVRDRERYEAAIRSVTAPERIDEVLEVEALSQGAPPPDDATPPEDWDAFAPPPSGPAFDLPPPV